MKEMILKADSFHLPEVLYIYETSVLEMNARGLFNWNTAYPSVDTVISDIRERNLYIFQADRITTGVFCMNTDQPAEYKYLDWKYNGTYLVVHRLAVHPAFRNQGIAEKMMQFAAEHARVKGYGSIRLDAITSNPQAMRLYEKAGYNRIGLVHFEYQTIPFQCMELKL